METEKLVALIGAVVMLIGAVGGLVVSLLGHRTGSRKSGAERDNVAVDTAQDALLMARETWRERISLLEEKVERLSAELETVKSAQSIALNENQLLKKRVTELERENHELRAFAEQLRLRNEALERKLNQNQS